MTYPHVQYLGPAHPDPSNQVKTTTRELDSRAGDGMCVRLLWHPSDGHLSVAVYDAKTGEAFELPVRDGERALDVFHHPFAYAAPRLDSALLASGAPAGAHNAHPHP